MGYLMAGIIFAYLAAAIVAVYSVLPSAAKRRINEFIDEIAGERSEAQ